MKKLYAWEIHDDYARYWTKESIENPDDVDDIYCIAETHLDRSFNPNDLEEWNPPTLKEELDEGKARLKGDMHSTWSGKGYLLSQNMVDKLGDVLIRHGQLFELKTEGREDKLYRYWATKEIPFKCVDKEKSKFFDDDYGDDDVFKIEKLVFLEDCQTDAIIFRITEEYEKTIFVSDEFIELVRQNDLKGFNFRLDTSYEYASKEGPTVLIG